MMKMAKASEADLEMAMELCAALETLGQRWSPCMPEKIEKPSDGDDCEGFSRHDADQCQRALGYLLDLTASASLFRVVFGMLTLLDPRNKIVDPDADTLERYPAALPDTSAPVAR